MLWSRRAHKGQRKILKERRGEARTLPRTSAVYGCLGCLGFYSCSSPFSPCQLLTRDAGETSTLFTRRAKSQKTARAPSRARAN